MADVKADHHRLWKAFDDAKLLAMGDMDISDLSQSVTGKHEAELKFLFWIAHAVIMHAQALVWCVELTDIRWLYVR